MTDDQSAIIFQAAVSQVRTLADGGIRVVLDLPEDAIPQMAMLAECKRQGIYLEIAAKTYLASEDMGANGTTRRKKRTTEAR